MGLIQKQFADLFSFTRASSGGRFNAQGIYEMVPANQPRIDYDPVTGECKGILIEEQRTNLCLNSEFPNGISDAQTRTADIAAVAFQGFAGGLKFGPSAAGMYAYKPISNTNELTYTISAFIEMDDGLAPSIAGTDGQSPSRSLSLTLCGMPVQTLAMQQVSATVYRVSGSVVSSGSINHAGVVKYATNDSRGFKATGYFVELGSFPTSYIPTTTAQVTRAADIPVRTLGAEYNASEGTLYVEASPLATSSALGMALASLDSGSDSNRYLLYKNALAASVAAYANTQPIGIGSVTAGVNSKIAFSQNETTFSAAMNGVSFSVPKTQFPVGISRLQIGKSAGGNQFSGHIRKLRYYPKRLTDAQLQALTA